MPMAPLRWGICASGKIAQDFAAALKTNPGDHKIVAIGARNPQKARDFAEKFGVDQVFDSCEALGNCDEVDVIYVASLTNLHYQHVKHFINSGKHVLCEKPMTLIAEQTKELIELAKSKRRFLMLALWSRFFPAYQLLRKAIDDGKLGNVKMVQANFCIPNASDVPRLQDKQMGGGAIADFGVYLVHLATWVYKSEMPEAVIGAGHLFDTGVDRSGSLTLKYSDNRLAVLTFSFDAGMWTAGHVLGDKGTASLLDKFWCPLELKINDEVNDLPVPDGDFNFWNSGGLVYEANHVKECLDKGLTESPILPHSDCQLIHDILEEGYKQLGVNYR